MSVSYENPNQLDVIEIERDGKQILSIRNWNKALLYSPSTGPIQEALLRLDRPVTQEGIIECLRSFPELSGAEVYFKAISRMRFGKGRKI